MNILTEHSMLGEWVIATTQDEYSVEFRDNDMTIRNKDQSSIEILPRDRSFDGVKDRDTVLDYIKSLEN